MSDKLIQDLQDSNKKYAEKNKENLKKHIAGQNPLVAVLTCADSRVIPEYIFDKSIGELFVVRVAGNVAIDPTVLTSLEYAVEHLNIDVLMILGHTCCGAVKAAEESLDTDNELLSEIQHGFCEDIDNIRGNLSRQLEMLPKRSKIIADRINKDELKLVGGIYHLESGLVEFI